LGEYVAVDSTFYRLLFKKEVAAVPSYFHIFLIAFLEEALIGNIVIIL